MERLRRRKNSLLWSLKETLSFLGRKWAVTGGLLNAFSLVLVPLFESKRILVQKQTC